MGSGEALVRGKLHRWLVAVVLILLAFAAGGYYCYWRGKAAVPLPPRIVQVAPAAPSMATTHVPEPAPSPVPKKAKVAPARAPAAPVRWIGQVREPMLLNQEQPVYPTLARKAGVPGRVHLNIVIGRDGTVQEARIISGHPLFYKAALDAVKKRRYAPALMGREPVEVQMTVMIDFKPD